MKITKFSKSVYESLDVTKLYDIEEALSMMMNFKRVSFNESVDVAFNLGVDPRHADENIRLSINLPHGIGKEVLCQETATIYPLHTHLGIPQY